MKFNGITLKPVLTGAAFTFLLAGCTSNKVQQNPVKESFVCSAAKCTPTAQKYSSAQLLSGFQQLLKINGSEKIPICTADSKTHTCTSEKVCYFVLGGLLPGNGCAESLIFKEVETNQSTDRMNMKTVMPLSFIGTNVSCDAAATTLSVKSVNDISIELEPYHCSWMVMGQMKARFSFFVDMIDIDHGLIGGHWNHSVAGTGNGSGSGYAILKFPKNVPWQTLADVHH